MLSIRVHSISISPSSKIDPQAAEEIEKERERSNGLVGRIAIMEANAARLGFDPEEMHKPILKPIRTMSRAGAGGPRKPGRRF
jgi:hypothetical protein